MNLLTFRKPDHYIFGNACEHGFGAFHKGSGRACAYVIKEDLQCRAHINLLEQRVLPATQYRRMTVRDVGLSQGWHMQSSPDDMRNM